MFNVLVQIWSVVLLTAQVLVWSLIAIIGWKLIEAGWRGGSIHPDDHDKPLHKQRILYGSPFRGRTYGERWGSWIGLGLTFGPATLFLLWTAFEHLTGN